MVGTRSLQGDEMSSLDEAVSAVLGGDVPKMFDACADLADRYPAVAWEALGCAVFDTRQVLPFPLRGEQGMAEAVTEAAHALERTCGLEVDPGSLFDILAATFGIGNLPADLSLSQAVFFAVMLEAGFLLLVDDEDPLGEWNALAESLEVPTSVDVRQTTKCNRRRAPRPSG